MNEKRKNQIKAFEIAKENTSNWPEWKKNLIGKRAIQNNIIKNDTFALISRNGYPQFLIDVEDDVKYRMDFKLYEVGHWDGNKNPVQVELYMRGSIKWDGCADFRFGPEDPPGGFIHLCSHGGLEDHCRVMNALFELAENIIGYSDFHGY